MPINSSTKAKVHASENPAPSAVELGSPAKRAATCVGGCGGPGLCPGIALLLAYGLGAAIHALTGWSWLGWTAGVAFGVFLLFGGWRWIKPNPQKHRSIPDLVYRDKR